MEATERDIKKWYPVCTQSRAEKKAYSELTRKNITSYLPLQRQMKQWSDRKKWVEEPLIRSYLFVHISRQQQAEVLMTSGIARFIYFSGHIASMPEQQIEQLKLLTASPYELEITENNLLEGEKITIKAGPLQGMSGEVVAYRSQKKLLVRMTELNHAILVHIPASLIGRR
ncbi:hypothetical protein PBAL39_04978 [Pedobacter sp. BAL39]|uniref:UpxY family transcription antiterminator n=1 Tax=Pedobacter sp. BAL39 TaxID=391596 RepID=UPI00015593E6|nr:UpxY family transcription antiterminator [Pedobacter sp. BAL39]EDM37124.1 hypothetical protein PBAL39_04978 [Pedobacter sp. BAL39]